MSHKTETIHVPVHANNPLGVEYHCLPCATVIGPFAIHPSVHNSELVTITHLGTKWALAVGVRDRHLAEECAQKLISATGESFWEFNSPQHVAQMDRELREKALAIIKEYSA